MLSFGQMRFVAQLLGDSYIIIQISHQSSFKNKKISVFTLYSWQKDALHELCPIKFSYLQALSGTQQFLVCQK